MRGCAMKHAEFTAEREKCIPVKSHALSQKLLCTGWQMWQYNARQTFSSDTCSTRTAGQGQPEVDQRGSWMSVG